MNRHVLVVQILAQFHEDLRERADAVRLLHQFACVERNGGEAQTARGEHALNGFQHERVLGTRLEDAINAETSRSLTLRRGGIGDQHRRRTEQFAVYPLENIEPG